ncbi:MAG: HAD-IIA family hydrolase [Propionibacteriaceae bacterium]|jgi:HAD superfamily hydrolase (TIGR01450 family)|nr:HAD-IIA family hydrolase [Propionibacteriaceae bacterium]
MGDGRLVDGYAAVGFDLDGVVYRGPEAVPGAAASIAELRRSGIRVGFVTNNAQRPPTAVAAHLERLGIPAAVSDIVTSAQAEARLMAAELPPAAEVLIVGSPALAEEIARVGLAPVFRRGPDTAAIVVGFEPGLTWEDFNQGVYAVQAGARYFACNNDLTRPTDQGIAIGLGGMLAAMATALPGLEPPMAGKPFRPLLDETVQRLGSADLIFVGDRLDTDIAGANLVGLDSLFVLSGSHGKADLALADRRSRPTWVAWDVQGLLQPGRRAVTTTAGTRCGQVWASAPAGRLRFDHRPNDPAGQLDALWAGLNLVWERDEAGAPVESADALATLHLVP